MLLSWQASAALPRRREFWLRFSSRAGGDLCLRLVEAGVAATSRRTDHRLLFCCGLSGCAAAYARQSRSHPEGDSAEQLKVGMNKQHRLDPKRPQWIMTVHGLGYKFLG